MIVNMWYNEEMNQWRWTIVNKDLDMKSGSNKEIKNVLNEIENAVNCWIYESK